MIRTTVVIFFVSFLAIGCTRTSSSEVISSPQMALSTNTITPESGTFTKTVATFAVTKTQTAKLKDTSQPVTNTIVSSETPSIETTVTVSVSPPPTPTVKMPQGNPLKSWKEIPIMPGAVTGDEEEDRYRFSINSSASQVKEYYKEALSEFGWRFDAEGTGENGAPIFIFSKGGKILSISVITLGEIVIVTIAPI